MIQIARLDKENWRNKQYSPASVCQGEEENLNLQEVENEQQKAEAKKAYCGFIFFCQVFYFFHGF